MNQSLMPISIVDDDHGNSVSELIKFVGSPKDAQFLLSQVIPPDANVIHIASLRAGLSGAFVCKAVVRRTIGVELPQVIKIGEAKSISAEWKNFKSFAVPYLKPTPHLLAGSSPVGGKAIVSFSFEGGQTLAETLLEIVRSGQLETLTPLLNSVLDYFSHWHKQHRPAPKPVVLAFDKYNLPTDYFHDFREMTNFLSRDIPKEIALPLTNSLPFAHREWNSARTTSTRVSICHGDLHPCNILHSNGRFFAIDFQLTGPDLHFLKDFVVLEMDSILKVLAPKEWHGNKWLEFQNVFDLKSKLFRMGSREEFLLEGVQGCGRLGDAVIRLSRTIRVRAWELMEGDTKYFAEYFLGLLRYAISRTGRKNSGLSLAQRLIAAHFAFTIDGALEAHSREFL